MKPVFACKSVHGGWQTVIDETGYLFGPVFNDSRDLWDWQRVNLPKGNAEVRPFEPAEDREQEECDRAQAENPDKLSPIDRDDT